MRFNYKKNIIVSSIALAVCTLNAHEDYSNKHSALPYIESLIKQYGENESLLLTDFAKNSFADCGFIPYLNVASEQWSNVSGGIKKGTEFDALASFGFTQDFSKLSSRQTNFGVFGVSAFYYVSSGNFNEKRLGALNEASNLFSGDMLRIFEIYYANKFETSIGEISFRIGQLATDEDFMGTSFSDLFLASNFGALPANADGELAGGATAFSQYSLATLGAVVAWNHKNFDASFGVYNGNCGYDVSSNNGFDYKLQAVSLWYQLGYKYDISDLHGAVHFGGNYHSGSFEDYKDAKTSTGFYSFYASLEQQLLIDAQNNPILGMFCRFGWAPNENISPINMYADIGFNWFSPLPLRQDDTFGVAFSVIEPSKYFGETRTQLMTEVTYKINILDSITMQPAFQVYFNKDAGSDFKTAYVIGTRLEINF